MKGALRSSTNRLSIRAQIFTRSLILAAVALITQTILVTEVNGAIVERESCSAVGSIGEEEYLYCCQWEEDTET